MKISKLACLALLAFSASALAYEGKGFKIISEKVTMSPGFDAHFESVPVKKTSLPAYVNALSWAYDAEGHVNENIYVKGDHNIDISNYTSKVVRYTYTYTLSCESLYANFSRTVELQPQGTFYDTSHSYGDVQKNREGSYGIHVGTKIEGGEYAFHQRDATLRVRK
jgi:hypothetical protein